MVVRTPRNLHLKIKCWIIIRYHIDKDNIFLHQLRIIPEVDGLRHSKSQMLVRPSFFQVIHGEYREVIAVVDLAHVLHLIAQLKMETEIEGIVSLVYFQMYIILVLHEI